MWLGCKIDFPYSCPDVRVTWPSGKVVSLKAVYDNEFALSEEATVERAHRYIMTVTLRQHRKALRALMGYVGGWDSAADHPCGQAAALLNSKPTLDGRS
jgi:hypothetical protein